MTIYIYNTSSQRKEQFAPITKDKIGMYVCGPTIYDDIHVGNARSLIIYDLLYRILKVVYPDSDINYVRNITDIEDKIIAKAKERSITPKELTSETFQNFQEIIKYLGCLPPSIEPKATDHLPDIVHMIEKLLQQGNAYIATNGDVYFRVASFKDYYKLSGRNQERTQQSQRITDNNGKLDNADFVLWKRITDEPEHNLFPSPFGMGRPGWHIECSAMSTKYLGKNFDIHGGGADLIFPHHTNEIAQSCCTYPGSSFAKYWVHNGFVTSGGEKMSKSMGNFITAKNLQEAGVNGKALRMSLMSAHYRKPLDFSDKLLGDSKKKLDFCFNALKNADLDIETLKTENNEKPGRLNIETILPLLDDINTPLMIKNMLDIAKDINRSSNLLHKRNQAQKLFALLDFLGINDCNFDKKQQIKGINPDKIEKMIQQRNKAKIDKDFATADKIRDNLLKQGVLLRDLKTGKTEWEFKNND